METYQKEIAGNEKVELIQLSFDESREAAEKWAVAESFPWPIVLRDRVGEDLRDYSQGGIPQYTLVKADGQIVSQGKEAAMETIRSW